MSNKQIEVPVIESLTDKVNNVTYQPYVKDGDLYLPMCFGELDRKNIVEYKISGDLIRQIVKGE